MKQLCIIIGLVLGYVNVVHSQDPQFTHLYSIPLFLGPSFAGATGGTRAAVNFRDQWTAVDKEYVSYSVSADHYFYGTRNGLGLVLFRDHSGTGRLTQSIASLQYSYSLNVAKNFSLRPGIQVSFANRRIDYSKLVFGDQLSLDGIKDQTIEPQLNEQTSYIDVGASLLAIYSNYWFGFSLDHLLQPNQSLTSNKAPVPIRTIVYAGVRLDINTKIGKKRAREQLYLFLHYNNQDNFNQSLVGAYYTKRNAILGLWYRGIPFIKAYESYINNDALACMVGFRKHDFTYLYSYDFTISKLSSDTAGSHEITIVWNWKPQNTQKSKMKVVPCPMQESPFKRNESQTM